MVSTELVGNVITGLRKSKGMSQEVLSGLAGLDRTHCSKIEVACAPQRLIPCSRLPMRWIFPLTRLWRPLNGLWPANWLWCEFRHTNRGPGISPDPDSHT